MPSAGFGLVKGEAGRVMSSTGGVKLVGNGAWGTMSDGGGEGEGGADAGLVIRYAGGSFSIVLGAVFISLLALNPWHRKNYMINFQY